MKNDSPDPKIYEYYYDTCRSLRLLNHPQVRAALREMQAGSLRKREEDELKSLILRYKQCLLDAGLPTPPPDPEEISKGRIYIGDTVTFS